MNKIEKYLVFATIVAPFTLLRFSFMGIGELVIIVLFLSTIKKGNLHLFSKELIFSNFWIKFLLISICGFIYNVVFLDQKTGTIDGMFFDFSAYVMLLISCFVVENFYLNGKIRLKNILKYVFLYSGIIYTILYIVSKFTNNIFGLPLKYYHYFAPFANNIHQTAMYIVPMVFLGLFIYNKEKNKVVKLFSLFFVLMFSYLTLETGSFKAYAGLIIGWGVYLTIKIINIFKGKLKRIVFFISIFSILFICLFNYEFIYKIGEEIFTEEDKGDGRSILYGQAIEVGFSSPIVGLGPGPHLFKGIKFWDSHETFITVFLQSGILGLILFIILLYKIVKRSMREPLLLITSIPILIYALGGDILRRLPVWLLLLFFYYFIISEEKKII